MDRWSDDFTIGLGNIPLANLRTEFSTHLELLRSSEFRALFVGPITAPIQTPYLVWRGMPGELLTLLLQRAIVGLEAWVVGAVWCELALNNRLGKRESAALTNPASLGGRGMAEKYYCSLPAMVSPKHSLRVADPVLFRRNKLFYRDIRNPVMHGFEIDPKSADGVKLCFEHLHQLYLWIHSWHDAQAAWHAFGLGKSAREGNASGEQVA